MSQQSYDIRTAHSHDGDDADLPGTAKGRAQRLPIKDLGKRKPPSTQGQTPTERAALAEVQGLRAELAKARADAAAAATRASEREPSGLGGSVDRLRSRAYHYMRAGGPVLMSRTWLFRRCCASDAAATWCITRQSEQGGAQGDGSRVCE